MEWIKRELVPHSSTSDAVNAWADLSFHGDAKKYVTDLEKLINHFPLKRESIIAMATKPLGKEIQKRLQLMNLQYGPAGITISQLKQAILGFLNLNQYSRPYNRERERQPATFTPRPFQPQNRQTVYPARRENIPGNVKERDPKVHVASVVPAPKTAPETRSVTFKAGSGNNNVTSPTTYPKRKYGSGPSPCFVCGSDKHPWVQCPKKKKGKCACCGSEAHSDPMVRPKILPRSSNVISLL